MSFGQIVHHADTRLRQWLKNCKPGVDGRLPSERALARELSLQHYAVNRAMGRLVAEGVVERRGYKLFYRPSQHHREKANFDFRCDLVIHQRSFHLGGYQRVARELGIDLRVRTWQSAEESLSILRQLNSQESEAIVLDPPSDEPVELWQPTAERLVRHGVPVVCINHQAASLSAVFSDGRHGLDLVFDHLLELNHEEIALLTVSPWIPTSAEVLRLWRSLCHERKLPRSAGRIHLQDGTRIFLEDAKLLAGRFASEWREVTALVAFVDNLYPVQQLLDELAAVNMNVPERLSLAFIGDNRALQVAAPSVTAAVIDDSLLQETAYAIAARAVRKKKEFGILPQPCEVRIQPHLVSRESTAPNPLPRRRVSKAARPGLNAGPQTAQFPNREDDLAALRQRPYDLTSKVAEARFLPLDLSLHVNRPVNFRRGWLGDLPLRHFPPGRHRIHGIPFEVLGGSRREDCGAVVFRSLLNTTGSARKLPSSLRIEVGNKVAAVYFLHGCGYARHLNQFAVYAFYAGRKKLGEVPLVALGKPLPHITSRSLEKEIASANIQDWWPDYPRYDFSGAKVVPLLENENPDAIHRHVFLYTLEWVNPFPQSTLTHITIHSDTEQSTTLGLLAVSALKPPAR